MKTNLKKYSISKIHREQKNIDLDPFFQRGKVWSQNKKQLFIDTILRGWGIPKIYFAISNISPGKKIRQCVDGKQRLSTILEFLDNKKFKLDKKISKDFGQKNYRELNENDRDKFCDYKIDVEEITNFSNEELSALFQRLQLGSALNSGEKLNAINGKIIDFARQLIRHSFFKKKISVFDTRHSFLAIAGQICLLEIFGIKSAKFNDLRKLFEEFKYFDKNSFDAKQIRLVLEYLNKIFSDKSSELSNRGSVVSAYLLVSFLIKRGNILGKQKKIHNFFIYFNKKLKKEIAGNLKNSDPDYLRYQTALLQAADSQKSILTRHNILLNKLANFDSYFKKLINTNIDEDDFMDLYNKLLKKHGGQFKKLEIYFQSLIPKIKMITCGDRSETLPTHIRHSIHHPEHKRHTKEQLSYSLRLISGLS